MTVGENIRRIRKEKGLTQKQLGERCDMLEETVRKYELGKINPKIETIQRIADGLEVGLHRLLGTDTEVKSIFAPSDSEYHNPEYGVVHGIKYRIREAYRMTDSGKFEESGVEYVEINNLSNDLYKAFKQLNKPGKIKAIERVEELTEIPKYRQAPEAHSDP